MAFSNKKSKPIVNLGCFWSKADTALCKRLFPHLRVEERLASALNKSEEKRLDLELKEALIGLDTEEEGENYEEV